MIKTARLLIRPWRDGDLEPFAAMSADPEVMRHLDGVVDREHAAEAIARQRRNQVQQGYCFWAVERRVDGAFLGFCGLRVGGHPGTPVEDELEIGWRLARHAWGRGYAREAAEACIAWGWSETDRRRILAWTVPANERSWGLMLRLGLAHAPELDFDHPAFPQGHPLRRHLTYRIRRPAA